MKKIIGIGVLLCAVSVVLATHEWDGNRSTPVHRIPVLDEDGVGIIPADGFQMPVSMKQTCGACHDYKKISKGFHFNPSGPGERIAQPWIWVDEKTGTQIPVSARGYEGVWTPEELGLSDWEMVEMFGRHMPGGRQGEPEDPAADPEARWGVSGMLEVNCLACHNASPAQDMTEWTIQIARENFRWAGTAASGIGRVAGMASRLNPAWVPADGFNLDDMVWSVPPHVEYDRAQFDEKHRVVFDIVAATDRRCLYCHSNAEVGKEKQDTFGDIHSAAGLSCVNCHRNGIDHDINRCITGEMSCQGCHEAGTYGAPVPEHNGLPETHLEKLSCTACHSGSMPKEGLTRIRTARANRLGIYGAARWDREAPVILEPVFMKRPDGKIGPHRMVWPAFWAKVDGDDVTPLRPEDVMDAVRGILDPARVVGDVLWALDKVTDYENKPIGTPVFSAGGRVYERNVDGGLDIVAEDVRRSDDQFAYIVSNRMTEVIKPYDSSDPYGIYGIQGHLTKVLNALAEIPDADTPVYIQDGKLHKLKKSKYETVSADEVQGIRSAVRKAKDAVESTAKKMGIIIDGRKFYRKGSKEKLKSRDPDVVKLKELLKAQTEAEAEDAKLITIGDEVYRQTDIAGVDVSDFSGDIKGPALGWLVDGAFLPLVPEYIAEFVPEVVNGDMVLFTEKQVVMALEKLGPGHAYVSSGKLFKLDGGALKGIGHKSAEPVAWPIAHDVRPAAQSLGYDSCLYCHSGDSQFFFGDVAAAGPLRTDKRSVKVMHEFEQVDEGLHELYGWSFRFREIASILIVCCCALVALVVLLFTLNGLDRFVKIVSGRDGAKSA